MFMKAFVSRNSVVAADDVVELVPVVSTVFVTLVIAMEPPYARASKKEPKSCCSIVSSFSAS